MQPGFGAVEVSLDAAQNIVIDEKSSRNRLIRRARILPG
jgi:hypothetical protein